MKKYLYIVFILTYQLKHVNIELFYRLLQW